VDHGETLLEAYDHHRREPHAPIFFRCILGREDPLNFFPLKKPTSLSKHNMVRWPTCSPSIEYVKDEDGPVSFYRASFKSRIRSSSKTKVDSQVRFEG
jgi:hypothetical protein